jgi:hypothetical protein
MDGPGEWDEDTPQDIIVATYGSVVFSMGDHSWVVATDNEHVLVSGGGPDDGDQILKTSYRSKLGVMVSGLTLVCILAISGNIKV